MRRTGVRARRAVAAAVVAVAMSVLAGAAWARDGQGTAADEGRLIRYTVRPGDTLWAIARRVGGPAEDPRPLVEAIAHQNGVTGSVIRPGTSILVPQAGD